MTSPQLRPMTAYSNGDASARLQSGLKIGQIVSADLDFVGAVPKAN
jgi:hypothetical protein